MDKEKVVKLAEALGSLGYDIVKIEKTDINLIEIKISAKVSPPFSAQV
jgi:hypothetical protein